MLQKYTILMKFALFVIILSLTACSGGATEPSADSDHSPPVKEEVPAPTPGNETDNHPEEPHLTRPEVESFELLTGEGNQTLEAKLHQGEGFSLYVFDNFAFDADEGRLYLNSNSKYEVKIKPLSANYDLEQLQVEGRKELEALGKVSDFSGELVEHPLGSAEIYLQASGADGISDYIVWKSETGDGFLFRLHNPKGEEASNFAGPVLVSLSTVQGDS
ncbi:hypothetical protein J53TS2_42190 [Paenibacillus sp. J53TS2]|uniref:hypothetical protein n=1 Tax=Paenibacillus sp. J53TS2 TaxID=2807197 RepID=UPI001AFF513D|nr:hypothetical protein [Paenibacillus sp. J53TS2]GIP50628.1 hypothetical protein J53TS2_42190 [Paenibacillus sp. J53TS2]